MLDTGPMPVMTTRRDVGPSPVDATDQPVRRDESATTS
jgi:hypothetical protein